MLRYNQNKERKPMYFIEDPTRKAKNSSQDYIFVTENISEIIQYLEGLVARKFNKSRADFLQDNSDLSGETDTSDEVFYDAVKQHKIRMGIVRKGGALIEADIMREHKYSSKQFECGN